MTRQLQLVFAVVLTFMTPAANGASQSGAISHPDPDPFTISAQMGEEVELFSVDRVQVVRQSPSQPHIEMGLIQFNVQGVLEGNICQADQIAVDVQYVGTETDAKLYYPKLKAVETSHPRVRLGVRSCSAESIRTPFTVKFELSAMAMPREQQWIYYFETLGQKGGVGPAKSLVAIKVTMNPEGKWDLHKFDPYGGSGSQTLTSSR